MNCYHRQGSCRAAATILLLFALTQCSVAFLPAPKRSASLVPETSSPLQLVGAVERRDSPNIKTSSGGPRGSPFALAAAPMLSLPQLSAVGAGITGFYKTFPLVAGFLTASTKAAFADSLAQYRDVCTTKFDKRRNMAMMLYSGLILGILVEVMYNKWFPLLFGPLDGCILKAVKMTLFDAFVNAPLLWLPPAYIAKAMVYGRPKRGGIQKYLTDVKENGLLTKYWSLWLPMTLINFVLVPEHFRVLFVASVSFFWVYMLSLIANNGSDDGNCKLDTAAT